MTKRQLQGDLMLLLTALIWGCAFVAQRVGMDQLGPYTVQAVRSYLGAIALIPVILVSDHFRKKAGTYHTPTKAETKSLLLGGLSCGICLGTASILQQLGLRDTDSGKAGFLTAMYILIVPVLGLFLHKKPPRRIWFCLAIAVGGLYLLCMGGGQLPTDNTFLLLGCAVVFSLHILVIDHFAPHTDCVRLSCLQFFVAGLIATPFMFLLEEPTVSGILSAWLPVCYLGFGSSGIAYTLQVLGQKRTHPTEASLLMSLESVFSVLAGAVILHQIPTIWEGAGCVVLFAAIVLAQLPERKKAPAPESVEVAPEVPERKA